jgi:hypothetical protein
MDLTIRLEDYVTPEEIKAIAMETIRESICRTFHRDEANINRLISNLSYEFIFEAVSKAIGEDAQTKISNKVRELLEDGSSIRYELWRRKDVWEKCESPAIGILHKAIEDNEGLIRNKVMQSIDSYDFGDIRDILYDTLQTVVYEKIFGKGGEADA